MYFVWAFFICGQEVQWKKLTSKHTRTGPKNLLEVSLHVRLDFGYKSWSHKVAIFKAFDSAIPTIQHYLSPLYKIYSLKDEYKKCCMFPFGFCKHGTLYWAEENRFVDWKWESNCGDNMCIFLWQQDGTFRRTDEIAFLKFSSRPNAHLLSKLFTPLTFYSTLQAQSRSLQWSSQKSAHCIISLMFIARRWRGVDEVGVGGPHSRNSCISLQALIATKKSYVSLSRIYQVYASLLCFRTDEGADICPFLVPWGNFEGLCFSCNLVFPGVSSSNKNSGGQSHASLSSSSKGSSDQRRCCCFSIGIRHNHAVILGTFVCLHVLLLWRIAVI